MRQCWITPPAVSALGAVESSELLKLSEQTADALHYTTTGYLTELGVNPELSSSSSL